MTRSTGVQVGVLMAVLVAGSLVRAEEPATSKPSEKARFHVYARGTRCGNLFVSGSFDKVDQAINAYDELHKKSPSQVFVIGFSEKATPDQGFSRVDVYALGCKGPQLRSSTEITPPSILRKFEDKSPPNDQVYRVFVSPTGK